MEDPTVKTPPPGDEPAHAAEEADQNDVEEMSASSPAESAEVDEEDAKNEGSSSSSSSEVSEPEVKVSETEVEVDEDGFEDVLGTGRLKLKRLRSSREEKAAKARQGQQARISIETLFQNEVVQTKHEQELCVGEHEAVPAIDMVLPLLAQGDLAEVCADVDLAYGKPGLPPYIPANAAVTFIVEILSLEEEPEVGTLNLPRRMEIGQRKKDRGNFWHLRGEFDKAVRCYSKSIDYFIDDQLELEVPIDRFSLPEELQKVLRERLKTYNNLAQSHMKLERWEAALNALRHVLKVEPNNEKALYRKAKILQAKNETEQALGILRRIQRLYPSNTMAKADIARLTSRQRKDREKEILRSKAMLGLDRQPTTSSSFSFPIGWTSLTKGLLLAGVAVAATGAAAVYAVQRQAV